MPVRLARVKTILLIIVILFFAFALFINDPTLFHLCFQRGGTGRCLTLFDYDFRKVSFVFSIALLVTTCVASFFSPKLFFRWLKFTIVYGIIVTILLFAIPEVGYGMGGFGLTLIDTHGFAIIYSILYVLISLPLLFISTLISRR